MKANFEDMLLRLSDFFKQEANTETVIGKEFKLGEFTCVPVIRLGLGFGYGGGEGEAPKQGKGEGSGAGVGLGIEPMGFLATRNEEITFISSKVSHGISAAFEKMPELLSQYLAKQKEEPVAENN